MVLETLVLKHDEGLVEQAAAWRRTLEGLNLSRKDRRFWLELLEYALVQRFPKLTLEEARAMLQLTPLEETVAGKQLIAMGMKKGVQKGEIIGEIRTYQRILGIPETPRNALTDKSLRERRRMLSDLKAQL